MLVFGNWASGFDLDFVSHFGGVASIMSLVLLAAVDVFLVLRMFFIMLHHDDDSVFHLIRYNLSCKNLFHIYLLSSHYFCFYRQFGPCFAERFFSSFFMRAVNLENHSTRQYRCDISGKLALAFTELYFSRLCSIRHIGKNTNPK